MSTPVEIGVEIRPFEVAIAGEALDDLRRRVEASYPNVVYFNEADKGGHFAAWEEPELFTNELRAAFKSMR